MGKNWSLWCLTASLTWPVLLLCLYGKNAVHFLLMFCNTVKWVKKSRQVYGPKSDMVRNANFLCLNVNDSYNYNMKSVELSNQPWNLYQVYHWMCKYKWWWYLFFCGHILDLVNAYIIYKKLCKKWQGESHETSWFWASIFLGKDRPHKIWRSLSSGFGGSTSRNQEEGWI